MAEDSKSIMIIEADLDPSQALAKAKEVERDLSGRKIKIQADVSNAKNQIKTIDNEIKKLQNRKAEIKLETKTSKARIKELEQQIKILQQKISSIKYPEKSKNVAKWTAEIKKLQAEIDKETRAYQKNDKEVIKLDGDINKLNADKAKIKDNQIASEQELNSIKKEEAEVKNLEKNYKDAEQAMKEMGEEGKISAYLLASAFRTFGNVMQSISRLNPFSDILTNQVNNLAGSLNGVLSEAVSGAVERYDKLKSANLTLMGLFGDSPKQVKKISNAISELDQSVIGLPTTLDDIVDSAKQYISITGDIEKGTKMAIATNRAFLASGADSEQVYHGTKQLYDLMSAGKLRTQEWESLFKAMPLALRKVAEEMGYTGKKFGDFRDGLKTGDISAQDFMNTLIKLGYEADGSIYKLAENSKQMLSSVMINWKTALKRGFANIITTFDDMSKEMTGESLTTNLISVSKKIDEIFAGLREYIIDNKEYFADLGRTLINFPIKEWLQGVGDYLKVLARFYGMFIKLASKAPRTISGLLIGLKPLGKFTSSVIPSLIYWKAIIKDVGGISEVFPRIVKKLSNAGKGAKVVSTAGKNIAEGAVEMASGASAVVKTGYAVEKGAGKLLGSSFLMKEAQVGLGVAIADLTVVLTAWSAKTSASEIKKAIQELVEGFEELKNFSDFSEVRRNIGKMMNVVEYLYSFISGSAGVEAMTDMSAGDKLRKAFNNISNAVNPLVEISSSMAKISASIKETDVDAIQFDLANAIDTLNTILTDIEAPDVDTQNRTTSKSAIEIFKDRLKELSTAMSYANSISGNIKGINWVNLSERLQNAINGMEEAFAVLDENKLPITSSGTVNPTASTQTADTIYNRAEAFKKIVQAMAEATGSMKTIYESIAELEKVNFKDAKNRLSKAIKRIIEISDIEEIKNLIPKSEKTGKVNIEGVQQFKSLEANWKNFNDIMSYLTGESGIINRLSSISGNIDKISKINWADAKSTLSNAIKQMFNLLKLDFKDKNGDAVDFDLDTLTQNAEDINTIFGEIQPTISNIVKVKNSLAKLKGEDGNINIGETIKNILSNLKTNLSPETIATLQSRATEMFNFATIMKSAMSTLKASVQGVKGKYGFNGLAEAIQTCIDKITELEKHTKIKIKVSFDPTVEQISSKIDTIISKINEIPTNKTATVRVINITDTSRRRWNATTKQWEYFHTGGLVKPLYRAKGGSIFKPKGTDRVPTMLTEGEFVMKRSAVQKFGLAFMNRLNNMDINGALKSLSLNGGLTTNNQRTINTVHNDNRKDTKVTVNQYMKDSGLASFKAGKALRTI